MRSSRRLSAVIIPAVTGLLVATVFVGLATASTTKGSPQPELKPFNIASGADSNTGSAMESNGTMLIAYYTTSDTSTKVCILPRAARACSHVTTVNSPGGSSEYGTPQLIAGKGKVVALLLDNVDDGEEYYVSTDGGMTFSVPTPVGGGGFEADEAVLLGSTIAFSDNQDGDGAKVASFSTISPTSTDPVTVNGTEAEAVGLGAVRDGLLVVDQTFGDKVEVSYAAPGADLTAKASYTSVGTFSHEQLIGMSGSALLTVQDNGKEHFELRVFNPSSKAFGSAHEVPKLRGTLGNWGTVIQDPHGVTHIFDESNGSPPLTDYDLYEYSTTNGSTWSGPENYGNATTWTSYSGALDSKGSGVVIGGEKPLRAWPVLQVAHVSFALNKSSTKKDHSVKASGKGRPAAAGRRVTLERLEGHLWHSVATTHESASGAFKFTVHASSTGHFTYRAVTADKAGYVQYGYSSAHKLTVKK